MHKDPLTNPDIYKKFNWTHHHKIFGLADPKKKRKTLDKGPKCPPPFTRKHFPESVTLFDYIDSASNK